MDNVTTGVCICATVFCAFGNYFLRFVAFLQQNSRLLGSLLETVVQSTSP